MLISSLRLEYTPVQGRVLWSLFCAGNNLESIKLIKQKKKKNQLP